MGQISYQQNLTIENSVIITLFIVFSPSIVKITSKNSYSILRSSQKGRNDAFHEVSALYSYLSRVERLALVREGREGAAADEDAAAFGVRVALLGGALALRRRVRERLDDRTLVERGHAAQDRRRERLGDGAHAHQHRRLELLDRLGQRAHERHVVRVRKLVVLQALARLAHEALRVHEPALLARLLLADALEARRRHVQVADARARLAGAEEQQALFGELLAREAQARDHASDRDGRRALNVVVERADAVLVLLEEAERVLVAEVLPLQQRLREALLHRAHELVDELVVVLAAHARLVDARVERVGAEALVLGAHVQHDGQRVVRVEARARRVERELPDRDAHAERAEVAESENALAVRHHSARARYA